MKKIYKIALFLSFGSFIFTQCKKAADPIASQEPTTIPTPTKECFIIAEIGENGNHIYDYTYNDKNQLVEMIFHTIPDAKDSYRFTYEYNDKSQRIKETTYTKNTSNKLASFTSYQYDDQGKISTTYHESYYDIYGNSQLLKENESYEYNDKSQLIRIKSDGGHSQLFTYDEYDDLVKVEYMHDNTGLRYPIRSYEYDRAKPAFIIPESWLLFIEDAKYSKHFLKKGYMYNQYGKSSIYNEMAIEKYNADGYPEVLGFYVNGDKSKRDAYTYTYNCK